MFCPPLNDYGGEVCQSLAGPPLDQYVRAQVLAALQPAALELSLEAASHLEQQRADLDRLWQQRLERRRTKPSARDASIAWPSRRIG